MITTRLPPKYGSPFSPPPLTQAQPLVLFGPAWLPLHQKINLVKAQQLPLILWAKILPLT